MDPKQNAARRTGPALEAAYRLVAWLAPTVEKFPRSQKFTLGDRVLGAAYDVLERLIEATYTRNRRPLLTDANMGLWREHTERPGCVMMTRRSVG